MGDRSRPTRILCINCNICVNTLRRYRALEFDTRVTTLLCHWAYPQIITQDDYVCEACRDLAMVAVNDNLQQGVASNDGQQAGPSRRGHTRVCLSCGCSTMRRQSDRILRDNPSDLQQSISNILQRRIAPREITESDSVCHPCWLRARREALRMDLHDRNRSQLDPTEESQESVHSDSDNRQDNVPIVLPNYRRAANCNRRCVFPRCTATTLRGISDKLRAIVLSNHNYYLPNLARVCAEHLLSNTWDTLYESENSINTFNAEQIQHVFSFVNTTQSLDFENIQEMDDLVFEYWTGLTKEYFNCLLEEVPRIREMRKGILGLAILLIKMRTGDSDDRISTLIQMSRRTLATLMHKVREILLQDFVHQHLGIISLRREDLINHNLTIPNGLFGSDGNAIVICDGTYIYINKSSNYMFQKQTYSLHKYRNLLKPFLLVAPDGYIIDCFGPYKAVTSDAEIMTTLFRSDTSVLRSYFNENDVFILDRGFRDSIPLLEGCGYKTYMPDSLLEGEHQLTTAQANRSRCITLCRWVVEAINSRFKNKFKLFRQEYFHRSLLHMMQNFEIAAAIINRFGARFRDHPYATEILQIIRERMNLQNNLANMVEATNMNRRTSQFQSITADRNNLIYFPTLEHRDLILFALGTYQIRQARSYYGEHVRFHGGYRIEVCRENIDPFYEYDLRGERDEITLIRGKIKSRHISKRQYYVYLIIDNNIPGRTGITEYCCSCLVGRRTVGCCAHVMTLVWYLGWARHQQNVSAPAEFLDEVVIREDEEEFNEL